MKKAGEIFSEERKKRGLAIDEVVERTKIPREFLIAIETDNYSRLPKGVYPQLYIREYARFLGLSEEKMAAIFRRDYRDIREERRHLSWLNLGSHPRWTKFLGGGLVILFFAGYLLYQYLNFVRPPKIKIEVIKQASGELIIKGKTDPRASLKIDGEVVNLDPKGHFSYSVKGEREIITLEVESPAGKKRIIEYPLLKDGRSATF